MSGWWVTSSCFDGVSVMSGHCLSGLRAGCVLVGV